MRENVVHSNAKMPRQNGMVKAMLFQSDNAFENADGGVSHCDFLKI